jgi:predicted lysophospholipase L1 biosynthesis ABC-type transport system permease subunit
VGFAAAAWHSVRTRRPELAVARALGLERQQTVAWLALELAFQLALGIAGGILLGMVLAWAVLPSVSLTSDGSLPVPAPVLVVPWDVLALATVAGVAVFLAALLPLARMGRGDTLADDLRGATP